MTSTSQPVARRYVVISPVRDEADHLEGTFRSMVQQTVRPMQWIVVNDGSTDSTASIIERWASDHPWIIPIHRCDRGRREPGTGVVQAFYDGYKHGTASDWKFLVKLDGDLSFEPDYFERCFKEFDSDVRLGIGGGVVCHNVNGYLAVEPNPQFHVRGANKIYKRECWDDIGGLIAAPGWDTVDEVKANMLGWNTRSFGPLRVVHHRFTGAANGVWANAVKNGLGSYTAGYHPLFMVVKSVKRLLERPFLIVSIGLLYGYMLGYLRQAPQVQERSVIKYLRSQQIRRLLFFPSIWK